MENQNSVPVEVRRHSASAPWTYADLDKRQREIAERARAGGPGAVLVNEVAPVITHGRRTPGTDLLLSPEYLKGLGIETYPTDRGGLATYHGPGQWVVFVVDRLELLTGDRRGVRKAVDGLLGVAQDAASAWESEIEIRHGTETGVWCPHGKFAAMGIHIEGGVILHGIAVNAFRTPTSFTGLRPCGLDAPVHFLLEKFSGEEREREFMRLKDRLIEAVFRRFWKK